MTTFKETFQDPDFELSSYIEVYLYKIAENFGIPFSELMQGKYDEEISKTKELIYHSFAKRLGFTYRWDNYYKINQTKTPKNKSGVWDAVK